MSDFQITSELLETVGERPLRVLVTVGNLFRAGELSAVRAPDLYGIKLDGERGQRTHIYTKEEILRDVVRSAFSVMNYTVFISTMSHVRQILFIFFECVLKFSPTVLTREPHYKLRL